MEATSPPKPKRVRRPNVGAVGQLDRATASVAQNADGDVISRKRRHQNVFGDVVETEVDADAGGVIIVVVGQAPEDEQTGVDPSEAALQDSGQIPRGRVLLVGARQADKETNPEPQESRVGRLRRPTSEPNSDTREKNLPKTFFRRDSFFLDFDDSVRNRLDFFQQERRLCFVTLN